LNLLIVLNPHARSGAAGRLRGDIEAAFFSHGIGTEVAITRGAGDAAQRLAALPAGRYDGVVAAGGDGTLFEVVNGLYRLQPDARPPLGHLPLGTGNAFARDLGLDPFAWQEGVGIIARGNVGRIDVAHVETPEGAFHFINVLGWGFVVDAGLAALRYKLLGTSSYTLGVLSALFRRVTQPLRIELDGQEIEQDNLFVMVSNSRYTGTHFLMAPAARLDDGLLDVTLVGRLPRHRLLRLFPTIFSGRHVDYEEVTARQVRHIRMTHPPGLPVMADGEFHGRTPLDIRCLPRDLALFLPAR